jgi:regulatory protein
VETTSIEERARETALRMLAVRQRTAAELRQRLARKDYPADIAERCVTDLIERGLVDDGEFAASFARDRVRLRPKGKRRIVQELRARGVSAGDAESAVDDALESEGTSEVELARRAATKWSPRSGEDPRRARARLYAYLGRRGFSGEAIRAAVAARDEAGESGVR